MKGQRTPADDGCAAVGVVAEECGRIVARPGEGEAAVHGTSEYTAARRGQRGSRGAGDSAATIGYRGIGVRQRGHHLAVSVEVEDAVIDVQRVACANPGHKQGICTASELDRAAVNVGGAGVELAGLQHE